MGEGMAIKFVKSRDGGMVPADHPDAAPDPAGGVATSGGGTTNAGRTYVDHRTYAPPGGGSGADFFSRLNTGEAVAEKPGSTWQHDGSGWYWDSPGAGTGGVATSGGGTPAGTRATTAEDALADDAPVEGSTTTEGTQKLFNDTLIGLLGQDPSNISISDPTLRPQADAFAAAQERARRQRQEASAERFGATGMESSGAMDAEVASGYDDMGRNVGAFNASLVGGELQRRRQEIMQAMALAGNMLNADLARDLQKELAEIDAALRREGLNVQSSLGFGDLSLRDKLGTGGLSVQLLQMLMGDKQFGQNLGFQIGAKEADLNNDALMMLLFGGRR